MKPIKIEKLQTWMGTTYRVYVHGVYMGAAATRAKALEAGKAALESWDFKTMKRKRPRRSLLGGNLPTGLVKQARSRRS